MGKPKAPEPPNPQKTAAAQTQSNVSTAVANATLGNVNQFTPTGSLTFAKNGSQFINDNNGQWYTPGANGSYRPSNEDTKGAVRGYNVPTYAATQTLSPGQQKIFDASQGAQQNLAGLARDQSARLGKILATPFSTKGAPGVRPFSLSGAPRVDSGMKARNKAEAALMARLQPHLDREKQNVQANLYNSGNMAGGEGYRRGIDEVSRSQNDARLATIAQAGQEQQLQHAMSSDDRNRWVSEQQLQHGMSEGDRSRWIQEALLQRQTPINETSALMGGSQVQPWSYAPTNMPQIPTTDNAGIIMKNYDQKMGAYQSQMQQRQNLMGGLFGLGASFIGM